MKAKNSVIVEQRSVGEPGEPGKSPIEYRLMVDSSTYNESTNYPSIINYHVLKIEADKPAVKITTSENNLSVWVKIGSSFIQGDMSTFFSPRDVDVRELQLRQGTSVLQSVILNRIKDGVPGGDAVRYWLVPSVTSVKKSAQGVLSPASVTCVQLKQNGESPSVPSVDMTIKFQLSNGLLMNYTGAVNIGSAEYLDFSLHNSSGTIVDKVRVPVVADGANGEPGEQGYTYRPRGLFANGNTYVWDSQYRDICLYVFSGRTRTFRVKTRGSVVTVPPTSASGDANWESANELSFVATDFILSRQISASEIDVEDLVTKQLRTGISGPRVEIMGSEIEIFGTVARNIKFGVDAQGYAVLEYYNNDGRKLYDLGPNGIVNIPVTEESWTKVRMKYLGTDIELILSDLNSWAYKEVFYDDCQDYYQYHSKVVAGVVQDPVNNGKFFTWSSKSDVIPLGYYIRGPQTYRPTAMLPMLWHSENTYRILTPDDLPNMSVYNQPVIDYDPIYVASLDQYVDGKVGGFPNSRVSAYWNGEWSENPM